MFLHYILSAFAYVADVKDRHWYRWLLLWTSWSSAIVTYFSLIIQSSTFVVASTHSCIMAIL